MNQPSDAHTSAGLIAQLTRPHNPGRNPRADGVGRATNACDEALEIWLEVSADRVVRAGFWSHACLHVTACGSAAARLAEGLEIHELKHIDAGRIEQAVDGLPATEVHCAEFAAQVLRLALLDWLSHRREEGWKRLYR
jgi:nitrogen fixation NifU-like protein